jgi:hypothetical protein
MINAKPRFGLEGERLFDYVSSRYVDAHGVLQEHAGEWDLAYVAELLRAGTTIEVAFTSQASVERGKLQQDTHQKQIHALNAENTARKQKIQALELKVAEHERKMVGGPDNMARDKVQQANADFVAGTPSNPNPLGDKVEQANRDFLAGDGVALNSMSHADLPLGNPLRGLADNATPEEQAAASAALNKLMTEGKQRPA